MPEVKKKILLVDDEPLIRKLTRTTLEGEDYEIFEAECGKETLAMARDIIPDLILLDLNMPDISGYDITEQIRKEPALSNTYIIMLAKDLQEDVRQKARSAGVNDFFKKPFSPIQLLDKIRVHFDDELDGTVVDEKVDSSIKQVLSDRHIHTMEELRLLENEQLLMYAQDLSRVYSQEIKKTRELNKAYKKLKEMEKMKDIFIALVSHELKTPLSVIKGYFYLLQEVLTKSSIEEDISGFTNPITRAIGRLEELMKELLDFSRMKSGLMTFQKKEINLPGFLQLIVKEFQPAFDAKKIEAKLEISGEFRPIKADYERLKEAFSHFVKNALNFTNPGGKFVLTCKDEGVWVVIRFQDNGRGIPEDKHDKIFNPFYQASDFLTREVGGMGLGLSIAKHIIEDHGGTISLESKEGEGSTFTIKMPRSYQDAKEIVAELKKTYPKKIEELSKDLKATQDQLLSYTQELSSVYAKEKQRTTQLEETLNAMERTYIQTIAALARTVDLKDAYACGHTDRVSFFAYAIAKNLNPELLYDRNFKYSLLLHDIGKIGVAEEILKKVEKLTDEEWRILKGHPEKGVEILKEVEFLAPALSAVRSHHERWDGKGYPDGLKGEEITLAARIISLADAFDAMTTKRPYRSGMSSEEAKKEIIRQSGHQFDPHVVESFLLSWEEINKFCGEVDKVLDMERQIFSTE